MKTITYDKLATMEVEEVLSLMAELGINVIFRHDERDVLVVDLIGGKEDV